MSRVLYHERKEIWTKAMICADPRVTDFVEVEVRKWTCGPMTQDVVIEARVMVDREIIVKERVAYEYSQNDAWYIRAGIARFDELLAAHPTLGKA